MAPTQPLDALADLSDSVKRKQESEMRTTEVWRRELEQQHGIHLSKNSIGCPFQDRHHTDEPFAAEDEALGGRLAYFLGGLFCDVDNDPDSRYWYYEMTSKDQWRRVARALRINGLAIADKDSAVPVPEA